MQYTQDIILELNSNTAYTTVGAKQGDNSSRVINVHITQNGEEFDLRQVSSTYFRFRKPDGKAIINTCSIDLESNTIKLILTAQTLAVAGRGYGDITLLNGSEILSTVSFIIIIMASPSVAGEATSSNEFGFLNGVVEDATHTIYEAQAWAEGKRGSVDVYSGEEEWQISKISNVIEYVSVDQAKFLQAATPMNGARRIFTFEYQTDATWFLTTEIWEGNTRTISEESILLLYDGVTPIFNPSANVPDPGDKIIIELAEKDRTYHNNAKYWAEQAEQHQQAIEDLTVSASDTVDIEHGGQAAVVKTIDETTGIVNLHFEIPQGKVGNVSFATFDINAQDGHLYMYKPDDVVPKIWFSIATASGDYSQYAGCLIFSLDSPLNINENIINEE